jgi:hypothetical protein
LGDGYYGAVEESDPEWGLYLSVVNEIGVELMPTFPTWEQWNTVAVLQGGEYCELDLVYSRFVRFGPTVVVNAALSVVNPSGETGAINLKGLDGPPIIPAPGVLNLGGAIFGDAGIRYYLSGVWWDSVNGQCYFVTPEGSVLGMNPAFTLDTGDTVTINLAFETEE